MMDTNRETNTARRLERIFLDGINAQVALRGLADALASRGLHDPELCGTYLEALDSMLTRIVETAEGGPARATDGRMAA